MELDCPLLTIPLSHMWKNLTSGIKSKIRYGNISCGQGWMQFSCTDCWIYSSTTFTNIFRYECDINIFMGHKHHSLARVCIAEYESSFNAGHINNLNFEGSKDYGLFHISNKFWCKDDDENPNFKNVCNMPCSNFVDQDLTDDLDCLKVIIDDTESWKGEGTGLTSWTSYVNNCQNRSLDAYMSECWDKEPIPVNTSKIFRKCELADVLENKHNMPRDQVKSWVCIAQYKSSFNAGFKNSNGDGSNSYGLFQINSKIWCKDVDENLDFKNICDMPCSNLLDADLTDDFACIEKIINEVESWKGEGTGLTAWTDYMDNCQNGSSLDEYMISECWEEQDIISTVIVPLLPLFYASPFLYQQPILIPQQSLAPSSFLYYIIPQSPIIPLFYAYPFLQFPQHILRAQQPLAPSPSLHHVIPQSPIMPLEPTSYPSSVENQLPKNKIPTPASTYLLPHYTKPQPQMNMFYNHPQYVPMTGYPYVNVESNSPNNKKLTPASTFLQEPYSSLASVESNSPKNKKLTPASTVLLEPYSTHDSVENHSPKNKIPFPASINLPPHNTKPSPSLHHIIPQSPIMPLFYAFPFLQPLQPILSAPKPLVSSPFLHQPYSYHDSVENQSPKNKIPTPASSYLPPHQSPIMPLEPYFSLGSSESNSPKNKKLTPASTVLLEPYSTHDSVENHSPKNKIPTPAFSYLPPHNTIPSPSLHHIIPQSAPKPLAPSLSLHQPYSSHDSLENHSPKHKIPAPASSYLPPHITW
ncbi:unnamed protein product, partial [Meganyctiphanes norvegica]